MKSKPQQEKRGRGRPPGKMGKRVEIGLRLFPADIEIVNQAVALEAARLGTSYSRAMFCSGTVVKAAKKIVAEAAN